jgi:hypothetical protein
VKGQDKVRCEWYQRSKKSGDWVKKRDGEWSEEEEEDAGGYGKPCSRKTVKIMSV